MRSLRLLFVPIVGVVIALATVVAVRPPRDTTTVFERVALAPERFDGHEVRVKGRVAVRAGVTGLRGAFALEGRHGRRLLILPERAARPVEVDDRVSVRGKVEPLTPVADDLHGDMPGDVISVADLAARVDAVAVVRGRAVSPN